MESKPHHFRVWERTGQNHDWIFRVVENPNKDAQRSHVTAYENRLRRRLFHQIGQIDQERECASRHRFVRLSTLGRVLEISGRVRRFEAGGLKLKFSETSFVEPLIPTHFADNDTSSFHCKSERVS